MKFIYIFLITTLSIPAFCQIDEKECIALAKKYQSEIRYNKSKDYYSVYYRDLYSITYNEIFCKELGQIQIRVATRLRKYSLAIDMIKEYLDKYGFEKSIILDLAELYIVTNQYDKIYEMDEEYIKNKKISETEDILIFNLFKYIVDIVNNKDAPLSINTTAIDNYILQNKNFAWNFSYIYLWLDELQLNATAKNQIDELVNHYQYNDLLSYKLNGKVKSLQQGKRVYTFDNHGFLTEDNQNDGYKRVYYRNKYGQLLKEEHWKFNKIVSEEINTYEEYQFIKNRSYQYEPSFMSILNENDTPVKTYDRKGRLITEKTKSFTKSFSNFDKKDNWQKCKVIKKEGDLEKKEIIERIFTYY